LIGNTNMTILWFYIACIRQLMRWWRQRKTVISFLQSGSVYGMFQVDQSNFSGTVCMGIHFHSVHHLPILDVWYPLHNTQLVSPSLEWCLWFYIAYESIKAYTWYQSMRRYWLTERARGSLQRGEWKEKSTLESPERETGRRS